MTAISREHTMSNALALRSGEASPALATVADLMRPPLTTIEHSAHVAAAAYVMKHAGATALMIRDGLTDQPIGIITEADIAHAVADGKDMNSVRIHDLMTTRPTIISMNTSVRDAATVMTSGHFRHLPVVGDDNGLVGIVDIADVCRALIGLDTAESKPDGIRHAHD
jgi:CBS domain-containing protein